MRNHALKWSYPKHNTPGTQHPTREPRSDHSALCLTLKTHKNLIDWDWPIKIQGLASDRYKQIVGSRCLYNSILHVCLRCGVNNWLLFMPQITATDAVADDMSRNPSSSIYCFLHVYRHSKIDYTFKLLDQYAWLTTNCPYPRIPKKKIDQEAVA